MISEPSRGPAYLFGSIAIVLGAGSIALFMVFLFAGSLHVVDLGLATAGGLVLNGLLCLVFFLQHSGMIRKPFRRWMSRFVVERYAGVVYTLASAVAVLALVILWQESSMMLASAEGYYRTSLRAIFFVALVVSLWGTWSVKSADLFGAEALLRKPVETTPPAPIVVRGPYRWVRHPIYLTTLLMIWSHPDLTADRLLFNGLFTLWIIVGTWLEERDLVAIYGSAYREYQRRVPMLIPYRRQAPDSP